MRSAPAFDLPIVGSVQHRQRVVEEVLNGQVEAFEVAAGDWLRGLGGGRRR